jgi:hypothetical protein
MASDANMQSAEALRLRKVSDECLLALGYLRNAARVLRDGDPFAQEVFTAMCAAAAVLNAVDKAAAAHHRQAAPLRLVKA